MVSGFVGSDFWVRVQKFRVWVLGQGFLALGFWVRVLG